MPGSTLTKPPAAFRSRDIVLASIPAGETWRRLYPNGHPNPLGFGFGQSRFSDPDLGASDRFGVVYFGSSVKVCFVEAILRDQGDGRLSTFPIELAELEGWTCATVQTRDPLNVVDLREDNSIKMGIPSSVMRDRAHEQGQEWSRAIWSHDRIPDGIIYDSRLNGQTNIALYDRALVKMIAIDTPRLLDCKREMAQILDDFDLEVIDTRPRAP
jgi:hypothetical protein